MRRYQDAKAIMESQPTGSSELGWQSIRLAGLILLIPIVLAACQPAGDPSDEAAFWRPSALSGDIDDIPEGRDILEKMIAFMSGLEQVGFEALVTYDAIQESGQKLHFDMLQRMAMRRPDKLFWITLNDNATADSAWFDAGQFRMIKQPMNAWGEVTVAPSIPEAVAELVNEYDLDVPIADVLSGAAAQLWLDEEMASVEYVGEAWVDGSWTDHIAGRLPGVDFELWVQQGDEPFPKRLVVVYTGEEGWPTYTGRFNRWATTLPEGALPPFAIPPDGEQVEVVPVNEW